eukprot:11495775-Alexandrium_andersonii.AAC.1
MTRRAPAIAPQRISTDALRGRRGACRPGTPAPLGAHSRNRGHAAGAPTSVSLWRIGPQPCPEPRQAAWSRSGAPRRAKTRLGTPTAGWRGINFRAPYVENIDVDGSRKDPPKRVF